MTIILNHLYLLKPQSILFFDFFKKRNFQLAFLSEVYENLWGKINKQSIFFFLIQKLLAESNNCWILLIHTLSTISILNISQLIQVLKISLLAIHCLNIIFIKNSYLSCLTNKSTQNYDILKVYVIIIIKYSVSFSNILLWPFYNLSAFFPLFY